MVAVGLVYKVFGMNMVVCHMAVVHMHVVRLVNCQDHLMRLRIPLRLQDDQLQY